jgi:hypothetical protein
MVEALLVDPETAMSVLGGREIMDRMTRNDWIRPRIDKRKLVRYATDDLQVAVARLKLEPLPD